MNPSTHLSLLLTISLISISHAISPTISPIISPSSGTKLYEIVCKDAGRDNDRCLKLLESNPKIISAKDFPALCVSIIEMGVEQGKGAQNQIKNFVGNYPSSKAIKLCASDDYNQFVGSLNGTIEELREDKESASYDVFNAGNGIQACISSLEDEKIDNPTITKLNYDMFFISYIAGLAIDHLPNP